MKKLTTTTMQRTLNQQDGHLTIGLDLGDRSSFYCVLDESGEVLLEQKVSTTPKAIKEIFGAIRHVGEEAECDAQKTGGDDAPVADAGLCKERR